MQYDDIVKLISDFEKKYNVNDIKYNDVAIWPIIRIEIMGQLLAQLGRKNNNLNNNSNSHARAKSFRTRLINRVFLFIKIFNVFNFINFLILVAKIIKHKRYDVLGVTIFKEHLLYKDKKHSFYIDPLLDLASDMGTVDKWQLKDSNQKTRGKYHIKSGLNIDVDVFITLIDISFKIFHRNENVDALRQFILLVNNELGLNLRTIDILKKARRAIWLSKLFCFLLKRRKPTVVLLKNFYNSTNMSIMLACKRLKIVCVDVQHGSAGKHPAYTYWAKIPEDGYDMLPNAFWFWGQTWADYTFKTNSDNGRFHKPIVGGHRWLGQILENKNELVDARLDEIVAQSSTVILVTLSLIDDQTLNSTYLWDAMANSPDSWLWLLRLHPMHREASQVRNLDDKASQSKANYDITLSSDTPLPTVLMRVNYHVTLYSHAVFEALAFGVPSVFIDKSALYVYEDWLADGSFAYAETPDQLITFLKTRRQVKSDVMETRYEVAFSALHSLLNAPDEWL